MTEIKSKRGLPVKLGGFSVGGKTTSVGIKIDREKMTLEQADALLCETVCNVTIKMADRADDDQEQIDGLANELKAQGEVRWSSTSQSEFGARLSFPSDVLSEYKLRPFVNGTGKMSLSRVGMIVEDEDDEQLDLEPGVAGKVGAS